MSKFTIEFPGNGIDAIRALGTAIISAAAALPDIDNGAGVSLEVEVTPGAAPGRSDISVEAKWKGRNPKTRQPVRT